MAPQFDMTRADAALKQLYKPKNFQESTYKKRPIIGILPKAEDFFGRNMPLVNNYGRPQGVSADFSVAQAIGATTAAAAKLEDFLLTRVNEHAVATIDGETLDAMSSDAGAFVDAMKVQVDGAMKSLADRLESLAPRSQTGSIGQLAVTHATGYAVTDQTIKLENINDVHNFEVGMSVQAAATDGGAFIDAGAAEVISAVDRINGILTATSTDWDDVLTAIADGYYLSAKGDGQNNSTAVVTAGLSSWLPDDAITWATAFFGVTRSADKVRLGGCRHGTAAAPCGGMVKTAIIDGASITGALGGSPDTALMHHVKYRQLCKEIDSQTMYTKVPARGQGGEAFARVSYDGIQFQSDNGPISCLSANKIPSNVIFLLELETWVYATIGGLTKFNDQDGNRILRMASSDGVEARLVSRGNIGCRLPGNNCRITHS